MRAGKECITTQKGQSVALRSLVFVGSRETIPCKNLARAIHKNRDRRNRARIAYMCLHIENHFSVFLLSSNMTLCSTLAFFVLLDTRPNN